MGRPGDSWKPSPYPGGSERGASSEHAAPSIIVLFWNNLGGVGGGRGEEQGGEMDTDGGGRRGVTESNYKAVVFPGGTWESALMRP